MYAIVDIAGQQFKVTKDQKHYVHRLQEEEGEIVDFNKVLLIDDGGKVNIGAPIIEGAIVSAKIIKHLRGDKVYAFKKKRRKGFKLIRGHRQDLSQIQIESIEEKAGTRAPRVKKEIAPVTPKAKVMKEEVQPKAVKKAASSKVTPKKTATKKTSEKAATSTKKVAAKKNTKAKE